MVGIQDQWQHSEVLQGLPLRSQWPIIHRKERDNWYWEHFPLTLAFWGYVKFLHSLRVLIAYKPINQCKAFPRIPAFGILFIFTPIILPPSLLKLLSLTILQFFHIIRVLPCPPVIFLVEWQNSRSPYAFAHPSFWLMAC